MISLSSIIFQVLAALGTEYFEHLLPDIIRNCSHQRASVRDGYLTLFKVSTTTVTLTSSRTFCFFRGSVQLMLLCLNIFVVFPKVIGHPISEIFAAGLACHFRW